MMLVRFTQMESKRYLNEKNLETWVINAAKYKSVNGVRIPSSFEVL